MLQMAQGNTADANRSKHADRHKYVDNLTPPYSTRSSGHSSDLRLERSPRPASPEDQGRKKTQAWVLNMVDIQRDRPHLLECLEFIWIC